LRSLATLSPPASHARAQSARGPHGVEVLGTLGAFAARLLLILQLGSGLSMDCQPLPRLLDQLPLSELCRERRGIFTFVIFAWSSVTSVDFIHFSPRLNSNHLEPLALKTNGVGLRLSVPRWSLGRVGLVVPTGEQAQGSLNMYSDLLFSVVPSGKRTGKEQDHELQNDGSGGIGWGVCCGHGGRDSVECCDGCRGGEDAGTANCSEEGHEPDSDGRGHCFAAAGYTGNENAGDWAEHVADGSGGGKVLARLQTLRG